MYAKISLISAIMKLKKSLDDCGIGEVKIQKPSQIHWKISTLKANSFMIIWSYDVMSCGTNSSLTKGQFFSKRPMVSPKK